MTVYQKSLLATAVIILAFIQLGLITATRGWLGSASGRTRRRALRAHHTAGYIGIAVILYLAYYCIFEISPLGNPYKGLHSLLGVATLLLLAAKVSAGKVFKGLYRWMPMLGVGLLATIAGVWLTSALWYLVTF